MSLMSDIENKKIPDVMYADALADLFESDFENAVYFLSNSLDYFSIEIVGDTTILESVLEKYDVFNSKRLSKEVASCSLDLAMLIKKHTGVLYDNGMAQKIDNSRMLVKFLEFLKEDNNLDSKKASYYALRVMSNPFIYSEDYKSYDDIKNAILSYGVSASLIPFEELHYTTIRKIYQDGLINEKEYKGITLLGKDKTTITNEEEREILDLFGYNNFSCVEDVIISKENNDFLSIEDKLLLKLYGLKFANKMGIKDSTIAVFNGRKGSTLGNYNNDTLEINIFNYVYKDKQIRETFYSKIKTIHHEVHHALQFKNIKEINCKEDPDILEYSKDALLEEFLLEEYYKKNYYKISFEFDADFKANIENDKLFKHYLENDYNKFNSNEEYFLDIKAKIKDRYTDSYCRDKLICIDEYFEKNFIKYMEENPDKRKGIKEMILDKFPIIGYEYDLNREIPRKKSNKEIVLLYAHGNEKEKEVYKSILASRCNEYKCGLNVDVNREEIYMYLKEINKEELYLKFIEDSKNKYSKYEKMLTNKNVKGVRR